MDKCSKVALPSQLFVINLGKVAEILVPVRLPIIDSCRKYLVQIIFDLELNLQLLLLEIDEHLLSYLGVID